jgi:CBS domain-containing protein
MNIKQLVAADLMTRNPMTIAPKATLREAAVILSCQKLHCLLVPGEEGYCVGVITSKDIVQILCEGEIELLDQLHVADAMTTPAITVQETFKVGDCLLLMRMSGVRSVPVLRGLEPVGVLSFTDVLNGAVSGDRVHSRAQ